MKRLFVFVSLLVALASADNYNEIYSHLKDMESFCVRGYIPGAESGVTIATGVDLGQWTETQLKNMGVPSDILSKLKPYIGYKTKAEVQKAGKNPKDLLLSKTEAANLDKPFVDKGIKELTSYFGKLSPKGQAVLVSVRHWSGRLKTSKDDKKLTRPGPNGQFVSYVYDAVKNKDATDAALLAALKKTRATHQSGSTAYNRLGREISYLNGSKKTPADHCFLCANDKDYCY